MPSMTCFIDDILFSTISSIGKSKKKEKRDQCELTLEAASCLDTHTSNCLWAGGKV